MWRVKYDLNLPGIKCRWLCGILPVGYFFFFLSGEDWPIKNIQ